MISTTSAQHQRSRELAALADRTRSSIVELLAESPRTATELHDAFDIAAPAVSRHLRVLREAGLIGETGRPGDRRVRIYHLEPAPLLGLAQWLQGLGSGDWKRQLGAFAEFAEARTATTKGKQP